MLAAAFLLCVAGYNVYTAKSLHRMRNTPRLLINQNNNNTHTLDKQNWREFGLDFKTVGFGFLWKYKQRSLASILYVLSNTPGCITSQWSSQFTDGESEELNRRVHRTDSNSSTNTSPCHVSSLRGGPSSIRGQTLCNFWWTWWHRDRLHSEYFRFSLSISLHPCSIHVFIHVSPMSYNFSN